MATLLDYSSDGTEIQYIEEEGKILLKHDFPDMRSVERLNHEQMVSRSVCEKKGDMHHVMRVPTAVLTKIAHETGLNFFEPDDAKKILSILKGSEYLKFRTYAGKI